MRCFFGFESKDMVIGIHRSLGNIHIVHTHVYMYVYNDAHIHINIYVYIYIYTYTWILMNVLGILMNTFPFSVDSPSSLLVKSSKCGESRPVCSPPKILQLM